MEYASVIITMHYHNIKEIFEKQPIIIKKTYLLKHLAWPRYFLLDINDPYGKPLNEVIECYKEIKECIDIFIDRTIRISETLRSPL